MSSTDTLHSIPTRSEENFATEEDIRSALLLDLLLPGEPVFLESDAAEDHPPPKIADPFDEDALSTAFFELLTALRQPAADSEKLEAFLARQCREVAGRLGALVVDVWLSDDPVLERLAGYRSDEPRDLPRREVALEQLADIGRDSVLCRSCRRAAWAAPFITDVAGLQVPPNGCALTAPLQIADLPELGIMNIVLPRPLGVRGLQIVRSIADHLAQAIHAAEAQRTEAAHRRLAELGSAVGQSACFLNELCAEFLPRVFHCYGATALWVNQAGDWLSVASDTQLEPGSRRHYTQRESGLTAWVWQNAMSLRIPDDLRQRPELLDRYQPPPEPTFMSSEVLPLGTRRQFLGAPLCSGVDRKVLGVLRLCGRSGDYRLSGRDERLLNSLAPQIAQIYDMRRASEMRERRLATHVRLTMELHTRRREEDLVHAVLTATTCDDGLGFNRAAFFRFDEATRTLCFGDAIGADSGEEARRIWEGMGPKTFEELLALGARSEDADRAFKKRLRGIELRLDGPAWRDTVIEACQGKFSSQLVNLAYRDPPGAVTAQLSEVFSDQFVIVPVRAKNRLLGLLCADNRFDRKPPAPLEHLDAFAQHLGMALELCRENDVRLLISNFNDRVAAILRERGEPRWMADRVLQVVRETLSVRSLALYHYESDAVLRIIGSIEFKDPPRYAPRRQTLMDFVMQGRPFFTAEACNNDQIDAGWRKQLDLSGPLLAFPLVDSTSMSGLLVVSDPALTQSVQATLRLIAPCLGNAVSHIALADKLDAREQTIRLLTDIPAQFGATDDEEAFANRIGAKLREIVSGSHLCAVYRLVDDQRPDLFERIGYVGYPQEIRKRRVYARVGAKQGLTGHMLKGHFVNVQSVKDDARWEGSENDLVERSIGTPWRALLGVPLFDSQRRVIGGITLTRGRWEGDERVAFTPGEVQQVCAIAQGVATIFEQKRSGLELNAKALAATARADALVDTLERFQLLTQRWLVDPYAAPGEMLNLRRVAHELRAALRADYTLVSLFENDGGHGPSGESNDGIDEHWGARAAELRDQGTRARLASLSGADCIREERECMWLIPLRAGSEVLGFLLVGHSRVTDFVEDQKTLLETWAALLASAIYAKGGHRAQATNRKLALVGKASG
jgi:transcriptional regulator with GAF, ATPase, and Fis domain